MIREIIHDPLFLSLPSKPATPEDLETAADLADTLKAHGGECVGMAANMIGKQKRIIVFEEKGKINVMFNPEIIAKSEKYTAQEIVGKLAYAYGLQEEPAPRTPESLIKDFSWDKVPKKDICLPEGLFE